MRGSNHGVATNPLVLTEDVALALRSLITERLLDLNGSCQETFEGEGAALRRLLERVESFIERRAKISR